jgi:hypothetical protein
VGVTDLRSSARRSWSLWSTPSASG